MVESRLDEEPKSGAVPRSMAKDLDSPELDEREDSVPNKEGVEEKSSFGDEELKNEPSGLVEVDGDEGLKEGRTGSIDAPGTLAAKESLLV